MKNNFSTSNLEDAIMQAWQTENDIDLLYQQYLDRETPFTENEVSTILLGLKEIHSMRMDKLWGEFEKMLEEKKKCLK